MNNVPSWVSRQTEGRQRNTPKPPKLSPDLVIRPRALTELFASILDELQHHSYIPGLLQHVTATGAAFVCILLRAQRRLLQESAKDNTQQVLRSIFKN